MTDFEKALTDQRRATANADGVYFPYSSFGCERAKKMLVNQNVSLYPGLTGWEIVYQANKLLKEGNDE